MYFFFAKFDKTGAKDNFQISSSSPWSPLIRWDNFQFSTVHKEKVLAVYNLTNKRAIIAGVNRG